MKMKINRKRLENALTSKEFKIYWKGIEPYPECFCTTHKRCKRPKHGLRPYHNRAGMCRYGNSHKSWKNYRKTQYRNINI